RTFSRLSSVEMQTNVTSLSLGFLARLAIEGSSSTHGRHQVAQTFRNTVLPLNWAKSAGLPSRSRRGHLWADAPVAFLGFRAGGGSAPGRGGRGAKATR